MQVDCQTRRQLLSGYVSNFLDRNLGARRELTVLSFGGEETIILIYWCVEAWEKCKKGKVQKNPLFVNCLPSVSFEERVQQ